VNLARNVGGAVGISLAQTLISRRAQFHHARLVEHVTAPSLRRALGGAAQLLGREAGAARRALAAVYGLVAREAATLAFIDTLYVLSLACLCVTPLVLLMRRPPAGAAPAMH